MRFSTYKAAVLAASTLLLCASSQAQWPARWNSTGSVNDEGQCVAVDHRGNVFVCGKSVRSGGSDWDMVAQKYDSTGSLLWSHTYDGAAHGNDVATSIAVDWEGNCYVAGVSDGGSDYDFVVIKYDSSGSTVWPSSGSRTNYEFHNGALRRTDSTSDGYYANTDEYICSMAMRNVAGAQPTFAIAGPTTLGANKAKWRTIVFEDDATDGVRIKTGWPVDRFGSVEHDLPRAVAIYTDDTVYVTGGVHPVSANNEEFTTVKYRASGTSGAGNAEIWTDDWVDEVGKPSEGKAIALDEDGNAFVTGVLLSQSGKEFGTRKILKDPDGSGDPIHAWTPDAFYDPGVVDAEPTGISLSFEYDSFGVWRTYAHVVGIARQSNTIHAHYDIVILRYRGTDGSELWVNRDVDSGEIPHKPHITAAGQGNVYVVGRTDVDYVLKVLTKSEVDRFTAFTYNGPASGVDEGRWGVMTSAGAILYTGASPGSGSGLDILTGRHAESLSSSVVPTTVKLDGGYDPSGDETDLESVDSNYMSGTGAGTGVRFDAYGEFSTAPTEISIHVVGHVSAPGVREKVEVYDQQITDFVTVSDQPAPTTDQETVIPLRNDALRYWNGGVIMRVTYYGSSGWTYHLNQIRWETID